VIIAMASMLGAFGAAGSGDKPAFVGALLGAGAVVLMPLLYGFFGALGALISSALYNVIAGLVGGVEITTEPAVTR
jgi:hypothetical protein